MRHHAVTVGAALRIRLGQVIGLLFLIGPISDLFGSSLGAIRLAAITVTLVAFIALYLALLPPVPLLERRGPRAIRGGLVVLALLGVVVLALGAPSSFRALAFYVVAATAMLLPPRFGLAVVAAAAILVGADLVLTDASTSTVVAWVLTSVAIGVMMVAFGSKIRANRELEEARHELARLAVTEERLRISRDVHDLLGHSLSVVALKSELAGRLIESDPGRARAELDDVQRVTRQALADVRAAVQGYRQLALSEAVGSARAALQAAGIDCRVERSEPVLSTEVESVLAWAVREATTNVVRHSNARVCEISVRADGDRVELAVDDDGSAEEPREGQGSGLNGLAERAERLHGTLEAGARPGGGFRLRLAVPLGAP